MTEDLNEQLDRFEEMDYELNFGDQAKALTFENMNICFREIERLRKIEDAARGVGAARSYGKTHLFAVLAANPRPGSAS